MKPSDRIHEIQNDLWKEYCKKYPISSTGPSVKDFLPAATLVYLDEQYEQSHNPEPE